MGRCSMLTACAAVLYLFMFQAASSADVDADLTEACRQQCSDQDADSPNVKFCIIGCQRVAFLALENRLRMQDNYVRTNRGWFYPSLSRWQRRMLASGIGSRSRSAGAYLRIGRRSADASPSLDSFAEAGLATDDRRGRTRSAGRYLRIGRDGESADLTQPNLTRPNPTRLKPTGPNPAQPNKTRPD